jgi:hypothetical protein
VPQNFFILLYIEILTEIERSPLEHHAIEERISLKRACRHLNHISCGIPGSGQTSPGIKPAPHVDNFSIPVEECHVYGERNEHHVYSDVLFSAHVEDHRIVREYLFPEHEPDSLPDQRISQLDV